MTTAIHLRTAALALCILVSSAAGSSANVALPTLAHTFSASFAQVQWVVLAFLLAVTSVVVAVGKLGDQFGRRRALLAGLALFAISSLACAAAPSLGWLMAARVAQGLGAASMLALPMALAAGPAQGGRAGSIMGMLGTASAVGTAFGPTAGGVLIATFGWRAVFVANAPLAVVAWLLVWRGLEADGARTPARGFDLPGALLLVGTLFAACLALTGHGGLEAGAAAGAGLALFLRVEASAATPLMRFSLFRRPAIAAGCAASTLVMSVMMATLVVGPFYLSSLGLDAMHVGLAMSCGPVVSALSGVPAGRLADRFGPERMAMAGLALAAAGALLLGLEPAVWRVPGYVGALAALTAGYAQFQAANNTAVLAAAQTDERGVVSGLLNLSRNLGLIAGTASMGAIYAHTAAASTPADGMHATFLTGALLLLAAEAALSLARGRGRAGLAAQP
ncbi:MAG: MFS transporter [Telluria sp.]